MNTTTPSTSEALARRQRVLAPTYRLFYDQPVYVVRADGVWMYDADGRRYLDAYNNVPVVGHCNAEVVARMSKQAATLNTHTRYLTDGPTELAERLLATLPRELTSVTFTCTGSESNDLAVRVSKAATGGSGFIVTEAAYHGTTETLAGMSPVTGVEPAPNVFTVEAPLTAEGAAAFGKNVRACIETMRAAGVKPAGLLVDTIFGSDGVISHPVGFLKAAVDEIHRAGGVFIADEVQPGFARTGDAMWGFQRHGITPDLVTMGKPMGNGHPVAALVARAEVMTEFAKSRRYFNTFGGNTVSCAAALAVLDIIQRDKLMDNARDIGGYLQLGLRSLAEKVAGIREVRGAGLFVGVQLGSRERAASVVNGLRREGVLIGSAGRNADALKIRPPLTITRGEIDFLLAALERVLRSAI
ncbi:MAG TPA: aminotransferase class III-fold pyridoxal phosphate-dependent enzyme [Steroidobacteraceae bacterium]|nr:aminotransferase class III-fold pyridoxal phosphate-dependent enzyme [Steroidobacteraceae bacterium]